MIICSCNVLSDTDVRNAVSGKLRPQTPSAVYKCLGCSPSCGRCLETVRAILNESLTEPAAGEETCREKIEDAARAAAFGKSAPSPQPDRVVVCGNAARRRLFAII